MEELKILIAEDDADDQNMMQEAITEIDGQKVSAKFIVNGRETWDYLSSLRKWELPDIIILDLNIPLIDGISVLKNIKVSDTLKNIPVYILTTSNKLDDVRKCTALGCVKYYVKPFSRRDIKAMMKEILAPAH
jgi:CheY-like chemotaxis protein